MKDEVPEGPTAAGQQELKERVIKKKRAWAYRRTTRGRDNNEGDEEEWRR